MEKEYKEGGFWNVTRVLAGQRMAQVQYRSEGVVSGCEIPERHDIRGA